MTRAASVSSHSAAPHLGYRPSLDGLRAFAVLVVMAHHAYVPGFRGGAIGVDVFFVLSGFLITSLLLEEWQKSSDISLRRFYLRRVLRLIPALVAFLLAIELYVLAAMHGDRFWEMEKAIAAVILYFANWIRAYNLFSLGVLAHTWSLSIEEQFYLIWPLVFLLLLRSRARKLRILQFIIFVIVAVAAIQWLMWTHGLPDYRIYNGSDFRSGGLLTGCALAILFHLELFSLEKIRPVIRYLFPAATIFIMAAVVYPLSQRAQYTWGWPATELAVAVQILGLLSGAAPPVQKLLECKPAVWTGRLSYGLYLWHVPVIGKALGWPIPGPFRVVAGFILSFVAAGLSYYFVELPFLRRKKKFASV
jgi:peptidoglycan/LPS O-acetylase OafA/YrhL